MTELTLAALAADTGLTLEEVTRRGSAAEASHRNEYLPTIMEIPPPVLPDVQLEFWGNFYVENNFYAYGILFATFLRAPREIADALIFWPAPEKGLRDLLPEQRAVAARLLREVREGMFA